MFLTTKYFCNGKCSLKRINHYFLIKLWRGGEKSRCIVIVTNFECGCSPLGVTSHERRRDKFGEPAPLKRFTIGRKNSRLHIKNVTTSLRTNGKRTMVKQG